MSIAEQMLIFLLPCVLLQTVFAGILYPRDSESRESKLLDGVWNFRLSNATNQDEGFIDKWFERRLDDSGPVIPMPVPSSFNDVTQSREIRDYIGWVWYEKTFFVSNNWSTGKRVFLRFGSAHYNTRVFLNGVSVVNHTGGHLPFQADVTDSLKYSASNRITVALNNTLTKETIPQGSVKYMTDTKRYPENFYEYSVNFDFFNYAGIHRSVVLYTTPEIYIDDVSVITGINDTSGIVNYDIKFVNKAKEDRDATCYVQLQDKEGKIVAYSKGCTGTIVVSNATFWWPYTMNTNPGYMYQMRIELKTSTSSDVYYQRVGIRTVEVKGNSFLVNNQPFYFRGFGKHEDADIRGKGLDYPLIIKDFNLIKWIGANSFRTSHYPYAEEIMDQADEHGIVVIDECPAVGLDAFDDVLLTEHLKVMGELLQRDKNRPSVVMWSVANEPQSSKKEAEPYFRTLVNFTKTSDQTRPVSLAIAADHKTDKSGQFLDVIMMNRYFAWYSDTGYLQVIQKQILEEFAEDFKTYKKPILISEYGADTISGLHMNPSFIFTEDYQSEYIMQHHKAFDQLRKKGYFIGEMIWNFADFMTVQQTTRVVGNKKGIFTRDRQPKASARVLRCRYLKLANVTITDDEVYCPA